MLRGRYWKRVFYVDSRVFVNMDRFQRFTCFVERHVFCPCYQFISFVVKHVKEALAGNMGKGVRL